MTTPRTLLSCLSLGFAAAATTGVGAVGAVAGSIAGNLGTDLFRALDRGVAERFLDGGVFD